MALRYRLLDAANERVAIHWWAAAFADDPALITAAFESDPQRLARSFIAQSPDGSLLAAITYWVRLLRDQTGAPRRVAHLWGVGTPGDAADSARQEHVDQLIERVFQAARSEQCELALFYPVSDVWAHYAQRGWQFFPSTYRQGTASGVALATAEDSTIRAYTPSAVGEWEHLAAIYAAYNATRPTSVVRDLAYWRDYLSWRWGEWSTLGSSHILVATPASEPATPCGYVIPKYYEDTFIIAEIGAYPQATTVLPGLVAAVIAEAARRGVAERFRIYFPSEPAIDPWANALFTPAPEEGTAITHAVYPLDARVTSASLSAMFEAPGSFSWLLDQF